ncbi:hypothetical protein TWF225_011926 [Orbilia oligospora]|uniref:Uncharacterized protein n=1 Tax=Orbilia oligospora TaxID=2813651 RepID=A0A8H2HZI2_ORBOL|nr:hypothetical protein TWF225_011926 [Orbilia oligospora]KAF3261903.1 hypothetical protein TWF217_004461 [Orbilia oligospora]KAF3265956.1 hypothetical protein TWF128_011530 [Orbilia oligospora]TGJ74207.1 hypothetical protein EYR41_001240 [Orbilia oligospora]
MSRKYLKLSLLSLLLAVAYNPPIVYGRVSVSPGIRSGLIARSPKGGGGGGIQGADVSENINDSLPTWFTKNLKKIDAPEPSIKASGPFIDLSRIGAQFLGIAGRAQKEEITIHVDDADLIVESNNYRWGGDIVGTNAGLNTHMVSGDSRYSALASMFRGATRGGRLVDDFTQVTLYNPKGSAEAPYKFLMSRANRMIIVERYRPNDDIAIETLNFGDITYLAWNLYAKQEVNRGMGLGDIQWIGLVDLNEKAQKYIKEGYDIMKEADPDADLSKPGFDRLVLSGTMGRESGEPEGDPEGSPKKGPKEGLKEDPEEDPEENPESDPSETSRRAPNPTQTRRPDPSPSRTLWDELDELIPGEIPTTQNTPKPSPEPEQAPKDNNQGSPGGSNNPDGADNPNKHRRGVRIPKSQNAGLIQKRQKSSSTRAKEVEMHVYNALIAIPSVREFTFMCVQKRAQLDHRSINLILTQPNRRSDDNSVIDIQMLLRVSLE